MDSKPKQSNKLVWLLAATIAFAGYYFYSVNSNSELNLDNSITPEIQANANLFLTRMAALNSISLETEIFDDKVFRSYQTFTLPLPAQSVGRANPFTVPGVDEEFVGE